jgi:transposase-like protein
MAQPILTQPHFQDEEAAREYLEAIRWANGVVCPHCGVIDKFYKLTGEAHRPGLLKCADCREQFSVTVGTVFESSKVKLHLWLQACYLMSASKKGISAKQLERMLGVSYKTAWFMSHRIREAMKGDTSTPLGGIVEVDETYWGTASDANDKKLSGKGGGWHKMALVSLVQRDGEKRTFHVPRVNAHTLREVLKSQVAPSAHLMTDAAKFYRAPGKEFAKHEWVDHGSKEYARGNVTTNTVESSFAIFKRGIMGTFHHVSERHLQRYATEFDFRWNHRASQGVDDVQRTQSLLKGIEGKRLTYRA